MGMDRAERVRRLQAAVARIDGGRVSDAASTILADLVASHDAKLRLTSGTTELRIAGVRASCTWGDSGLLANWRAAALRRLGEMG
jgi:hypothetical protein